MAQKVKSYEFPLDLGQFDRPRRTDVAGRLRHHFDAMIQRNESITAGMLAEMEKMRKEAQLEDARCRGCVFWEQNLSGGSSDGYGTCRRYAPRPRPEKGGNGERDPYFRQWPETVIDDWCGEFRRKDKKPE